MSKRKYRGPKLIGQWVPHPAKLLRALRELSLTARRILDTLEIENCRHSGRENGQLVCTYNDLENSGIDRTCIREALDELIAAGLIEIPRLGRRAYADLRCHSLYRLTYLHAFKNGQWAHPTHEWKKQNASGKNATGTSGKSATGNGQIPVGKVPPVGAKSQWVKCHSLIDLGEEGGGSAADFSNPAATPPAHPLGAGPSAPPSPSDQLPSATALSSGRLQ